MLKLCLIKNSCGVIDIVVWASVLLRSNARGGHVHLTLFFNHMISISMLFAGVSETNEKTQQERISYENETLLTAQAVLIDKTLLLLENLSLILARVFYDIKLQSYAPIYIALLEEVFL